jgi:glycosyltransferase involved in cell wall biosynthesis
VSVRWHILTPEFPPGCGGVGDYVAQLAPALASSDGAGVTVWTAPQERAEPAGPDVDLVALPDRFGRQSRRVLDERLDAEGADARLLVQYVGNVFGMRGANVPFCRWVHARHQRGQDVRVMFHEPYLYYRWRPDHLAVAAAERVMARLMVRAASRLYLSTATWRRYLSRFDPRTVERASVLPIPSAIPRVEAPDRVASTRRAALRGRAQLVGHFGTYGGHVAPPLAETLASLLDRDAATAVACIGGGSEAFVARLVARHPALAGRITATGRAPANDVSCWLQACDLLVQPYPDGVTTRRTSVMAGLANGRPVLTVDGPLTEAIWRDSGAVACARGDPAALADMAHRLLHDGAAREALGAQGLATYESCFALRHTVAALTAPVEARG